jgi:hypothetical protein
LESLPNKPECPSKTTTNYNDEHDWVVRYPRNNNRNEAKNSRYQEGDRTDSKPPDGSSWWQDRKQRRNGSQDEAKSTPHHQESKSP